VETHGELNQPSFHRFSINPFHCPITIQSSKAESPAACSMKISPDWGMDEMLPHVIFSESVNPPEVAAILILNPPDETRLSTARFSAFPSPV
jgi:hypothetical protein